MTRKLWPLAALAAVALVAAGCSNAPAGSATASTHATALKFAECMRDNGVKGFPDPDASDPLTIDGVVNGSSLDPSAPSWKKAVAACKDLQPAGFMGDRHVTDAQRKQRLEFARCMRDNGVKDFPDPADGEPLVDTNRIPSAAEPGGMTVLRAAMQTCRDFVGEATGGQR